MAMFGNKQLCLIIVFLFTFPVLMEVPAILTDYKLSFSRRPTGSSAAARPWDWWTFILMCIWDWFKLRAMGKLTLKPQLSMGSAKRLYCLWQVLYMHLAFKRNFSCHQQWECPFTTFLAYSFFWFCIFLVKQTMNIFKARMLWSFYL